eukprot:TRINITY_DN204_c2_g1_i1.p1 TRINITY_DN204_c2_g1~~TRINITY_DN204_c2_g1_i1.p1  ORF type:complete len:357 (+),score=159.03 TRINITY_DN204_c2_g1_i1:814-1884(+)
MQSSKRILVTGGAGFIGSHTCVSLSQQGYQLIVLDSLCNSKPSSLSRIQQLIQKKLVFYQGDVRNTDLLETIFQSYSINAVIHFASLKSVSESVSQPLNYYDNNLISIFSLLKTMKKFQVRNFIFSSSATVYGDNNIAPFIEDLPVNATNPYGFTKCFIEQILKDYANSDKDFKVSILRYFNPVGAHPTGLIGEDPKGIPQNLLPFITRVAIGTLPVLKIYGTDYPTPDGTAIRDYIHVVDVADGHIAALKYLEDNNPGCYIFNLGTGKGNSVLEVHAAMEKAAHKKIPYILADRRPGDIATAFADCSKATRELNWQAKYTLQDMCDHAWNFQSKNPNGYSDDAFDPNAEILPQQI